MVNEYIGKICPFCKSEFKPDDEIVVCSACDMPHHKDCWIENQGCTTFGCLGSIKSADGSTTIVTATEISFDDPPQTNNLSTIYCTRCGSPNNASASFCSKCGNRLVTNIHEQQPHNYESVSTQYNYQQGYSQNSYQHNTANNQTYSQYNTNVYGNSATIDNDVIQLIGTKSEYYVPKFQEMKQQNKKTSWNWAAFLVAPYWFIYRKMYGYGYGILAVALILSLIPVLPFFALGGYIALGIFGNYIYMSELEKKALQVRAMTEPYRSQYIYKNGGTNTTATVITIIAYVVLTVIISA